MARYASSEATKQALVMAAGELFSEHGIKEVTTRAIAQKAGENIGNIKYHFGNKEGLFDAVLAYASRQWRSDPVGSHLREHEELLATREGQARLVAELIDIFLDNILFAKATPPWCGVLMFQVLQRDLPASQRVFESCAMPVLEAFSHVYRRVTGDDDPEKPLCWVTTVTAPAHLMSIDPATFQKAHRLKAIPHSLQLKLRDMTVKGALANLGLNLPAPERRQAHAPGKNVVTAVVAALLLALVPGCWKKTEAEAPVQEQIVRPVKLMAVGGPANGADRHYPAKVRANQRVKLAFQVAGQIVKFPVKCGDRVKKGQLLAELDPRDFENAAKAAAARFQESRTDFERQARLVEKKVVAVSVFEAKRMAYEVASSDLRSAEKALADTKLQAPFDGMVAGTYADNFQNVNAQEPVVSLQDISSVELVFNVPEKDVIRATAGMTKDKANHELKFLTVFPSLGNRSYQVSLKEFETEAEAATQTFRMVMTMPSPKDANIMPGMTALVSAPCAESTGDERGHWIPATAVAEDSSGRRYVWVVGKDMRAHKRQVAAGPISGENILVESGLRDGERIAVAGVSQIGEGMELKELKQIDGRKL